MKLVYTVSVGSASGAAARITASTTTNEPRPSCSSPTWSRSWRVGDERTSDDRRDGGRARVRRRVRVGGGLVNTLMLLVVAGLREALA